MLHIAIVGSEAYCDLATVRYDYRAIKTQRLLSKVLTIKSIALFLTSVNFGESTKVLY